MVKQHRLDIDGLRAFAVFAVIINHADAGALQSGFLGVDIFFVISGYVITRSLLGQPDNSLRRFLTGFYSRRFKRLMPALLLCVTVTVAVLFLVDPDPAISFRTGLLALLGLGNVFLYIQSLDYFSADIAFNAFTHTWSLGVEEQFYLVAPALIWSGLRLSGPGSRHVLFTVMATLSALSLLLFLTYWNRQPLASFYLLHTRLWELGVGVLLALTLPSDRADKTKPLRWFGWQTGILVLLVGSLTLSDMDGRWLILLAVSGTAGIIAAPDRSRFLHNRPAVYLGAISYSLYLWHWPLLVFRNLSPDHVLTSPEFLIGLLFLAATLSYHLVEHPLRHRPWWPNRRSAAGTICLGLCIALGALSLWQIPVGQQRNLSTLERPTLMLPTGLPHDPTCVVDDGRRPLRPETFTDCTFPPLAGSETRTIWAMGDSHIGHFQALLVALHEDTGVGFHLVETPGQLFPPPTHMTTSSRDILLNQVKRHLQPGDIIFISRIYLTRTVAPALRDDIIPEWLPVLSQFAEDMKNRSVEVIVAGPPPMYNFADIRICQSTAFKSCAVPRRHLEPVITQTEALLAQLAEQHDNLKILRVFDQLCPPDKPVCLPLRNGFLTMRDRDHLNALGALLLKKDFMKIAGLTTRPSH